MRLKKVTYPSGREVHYIYEAPPTSRLTSISENSGGTQNLVTYTYLGMNTIVKESHPQVSGGLNLTYGSAGTYAGWDRFGQIVQQLWKNDAGTTVDGYTYTYDRAGNRTARANTLNSAFSETYAYDDLNRLVDANRNGTNLQDWTLDALGNWSGFTDGATSQTRTHDAANQTTDISGSWIDPTYDAAGNMTSGPKAGDETTRLHFVYDAWNRLVAVKADDDGEPGTTIATYAYDGMGRRISKTVGADTFDFYYNENYQVVEVSKNGDTDPYEQYVYDVRYVDAPVMVYRDTNTDGSGIQSVYVTQDANFDVTGIIDGSNGTVINRFVYTPYGQRTVLNASWTAGTTDFWLGHQGLRLDEETGFYDNRARTLNPNFGFIQRDPLGYVDGGSLYEYLRERPTSMSDPGGTNAVCCNGVSYNPDTHCCCNGKINKRGLVTVGIKIWEVSSDKSGTGNPHGWIEIDGETWGFYPIEGIWWPNPGEIHHPDDHGNKGEGKVVQDVKLDPCILDVAKYKKAILSQIAQEMKAPPHYSLITGQICYWWPKHLLDDAYVHANMCW